MGEAALIWDDGWVKIYHGDALEILPAIADGLVDMVLTDPPMNISSEVVIHRSMNPIKYRAKKSIVLDFGDWDHFESEENYWNFTKRWFKECIRVLRKAGHLISFFDQNKSSYLIDYAKSLNMLMRQHIYWIKSNPVPRGRCVDFMIALEHALWFTKETKSRKLATFNYQLGQQTNYIVAPIPNNPRYHPTQKPVEVLEVWINYLTNPGDTILDPFVGSGSTLVAAKKLARKAIGIELEPKYCQIAKKRVEEVSLPLVDH